jgi:Spy/CpxP family protein refolding chaperone
MPNRVTWSHPKVITALLVVFLAGAASGAIALRTLSRNTLTGKAKAMRSMDRKELMDYFRREMDLNDNQRQRVESLLEDHFKMLQMLGAQTEEVRVHGRESIAKLLTGEQRKKFEGLMSEWQRSQR